MGERNDRSTKEQMKNREDVDPAEQGTDGDQDRMSEYPRPDRDQRQSEDEDRRSDR